MEGWIVGMVAVNFAFVGWILWVIAYYRSRRAQQRSEERLRVLERFGTGQDLGDFLNSEASDKMLELLTSSQLPGRAMSVRGWILVALNGGILCLFIGCGFGVLAWLEIWNDPDFFLVPGVIGVAAGVGMMLASAVSAWSARGWDDQTSKDD